MRAAWLALPAGVALVLALAGLEPAPADSQAVPAAPAAQPSPPPTAGSAAELLGITNAISLPRRELFPTPPPPEELERALRADAQLAAALGARWVRAHSANWPHLNQLETQERGLVWMDLWVRLVQEADLQGLVMLSPWPGDHTGDYTDRYPPPDEAAYAAWVRQVVERYDGDGVDDMPGLERPIRHWEVDNEPDVKNTVRPRNSQKTYDPTTFCTPAEYARVLRVTAEAIRAADPEAVVLNGGFYRPHTPHGLRYMQQVFAEPGAAEAIDVLNLHVYSNDPSLEPLRRAVANARSLGLERPIWMSELSVPSDGKDAWLSEDWQAEMVPRLVAEVLRLGVERLFWHSLADPPREVTSRVPMGSVSNFWFHSLSRALEDGGYEVKPAGHAWRALAARLAQVPRSAVQPEPWGLRIGEDRVLTEGELVLPASGQAVRLRDSSPVPGTADPGGRRYSAADGAVLWMP